MGELTTKKLTRVRRICEIIRKHLVKEQMRAFYMINGREDDDSYTQYSTSQVGTPLYSKLQSKKASKNPSRNVSTNKKRD